MSAILTSLGFSGLSHDSTFSSERLSLSFAAIIWICCCFLETQWSIQNIICFCSKFLNTEKRKKHVYCLSLSFYIIFIILFKIEKISFDELGLGMLTYILRRLLSPFIFEKRNFLKFFGGCF